MARVLIFDSGVGGLSVLRELQAVGSGLEITYLADTGYYPYGTKNDAALIERLPRLLSLAADKYEPDVVVIACNTASTIALEEIRSVLKCAVVGTVPAIKPASGMSKSKVIGLLGTPGTIARAYTDDLISDFAGDCHVIRYGSADLVDLAERELKGEDVALSEVMAAAQGLFLQERSEEIDTVVLACTHYPLMREKLKAALGRPLQWIDSGQAIARRVIDVLGESQSSTGETKVNRLEAFVVTGPAPESQSIATQFGFSKVETFSIET
jgi:glutamate racemase